MSANPSFPLRGVIGVVANSADELAQAIDCQLQCVEIRADLLLDSRLSLDDVLALIARAKSAGIATLLTLRHPSHGGKFGGSERERVDINRRALAAGADMIDLEWRSEAASMMLAERAPLILSHHDFTAMPDETTLADTTSSMLEQRPMAIKLVPTAAGYRDALRMLRWVADAKDDIARIGFAMGEAGEISRILTTLCGAPITYTSFGPAVAPGQIEMHKLLNEYRVMQMNGDTTVVAGSAAQPELLARLNAEFARDCIDSVAVGFAEEMLDEVRQDPAVLPIAKLQFV